MFKAKIKIAVAKTLVFASIFCNQAFSQGNIVDSLPLKKTLTVSVLEEAVIAEAEFENVSTGLAYVLQDPVNFFLYQNGREIKSVGPMMSRREYTIDDYELLKPGQKTVRKSNIEKKFAFELGRKEYELRMFGGYMDPQTRIQINAPEIRCKFIYTKL